MPTLLRTTPEGDLFYDPGRPSDKEQPDHFADCGKCGKKMDVIEPCVTRWGRLPTASNKPRTAVPVDRLCIPCAIKQYGLKLQLKVMGVL